MHQSQVFIGKKHNSYQLWVSDICRTFWNSKSKQQILRQKSLKAAMWWTEKNFLFVSSRFV